jgi:hypothetical protein
MYTNTQRVNLIVTKAPLTVTADSKVRGYGEDNPPLTLSYEGFVGADGEADLLNQPAATTTPTVTTPQGVYPIVVGGGDDANYSFTYINGTLTIGMANTNVIVTSSANPSYYRQVVTFTASLMSGMPSGAVTFYNDGVMMGTSALVNGVATLVTGTLPVGTHPITATYGGDTNYNGSTSEVYTQTVYMPTNVIAGVASVKMGTVFVYSVVISNPNSTPLYDVVITGSIPAEGALVSWSVGDWVTTGGDYGNGYITSGVIPSLAPGESYTLEWTVQPMAFLADMSTQAHATSENAVSRLTLFARVYRLILPLIFKAAATQ